MPRRNLFILLAVALVSIACYRKADSAHRSRYGRMFDTFVEILEEVETNYYEPLDERKLFEGALAGLVDGLDPYSAYLPPVEATRSRQHLEQAFGGIGIEVTFDTDRTLTIASPLVGTPAYEAGLLAGDKIVKINDEPTEGFTFDDALQRLRGPIGQAVTLDVLHPGEKQTVRVRIVRAQIKVDAVLGDRREPDGRWNFMLPGDEKIGYVRVVSFGRRQVEELAAALEQLRAAGARGLILDLRNNGGGLLEGAIDTCNFFLRGDQRDGIIVTVQGRDRMLSQHHVRGDAPYVDWPLAVLVNQHSASASEIVAACLQDHGRAVVVGQRTFGKGTVQEIKMLERGQSELRLTIARYLRPSFANIHRSAEATENDEWGVRPDPGLEVKLSDEEFGRVFRARRERDRLGGAKPASAASEVVDPQLEKAREQIRTRLAASPASQAT